MHRAQMAIYTCILPVLTESHYMDHKQSQDRRSLFVFELDGLSAILWEEHLLPLTDVDRYELAVLQVSSPWASRHN